jgi:hypothetical protein
VVALELAGELTASALDANPPRRPMPVHGGVDADDLPYRPELRIGVRSSRELDAEGVGGGVPGPCCRRYEEAEASLAIERGLPE